MSHQRFAIVAWFAGAWLVCVSGCAPKPAETACVSLPTAAPTQAAAAPATQQQPLATSALSAAGTWLFHCCDGTAKWVGMLTLVDDHGALHGAWLTDGDSHGSYVEGHVDGTRVQLRRRWRTGGVLHDQEYDLRLDASGQHLGGSFREPAFDATPHSIQLERGFVAEPRQEEKREPVTPVLTPNGLEKQGPARDPKRPCDCGLVCYCGGIPPGADHYEEAARCGGSCKCPVCPPLP